MAEGKGMSKGCTVALIVAGVILVLIIALAVTCYFYWGDVVKSSTTALVGEVKSVLAANPPEGVDTTQFDALADAFVERFDPGNMKAEDYAPVVAQLSEVLRDKQLTADEVSRLSESMVALYPDLDRFRPSSTAEPAEVDFADPDTTDAVMDTASGL